MNIVGTNQNNRKLLQYAKDIENINGTILYEFHRSKIKEFYRLNGIRIETVKRKLQKVAEEFFVIEGVGDERKVKYTEAKVIPAVYEDKVIPNKFFGLGKPKIEKVLITPEQKINPEPVFQEGKTQEEYQKRYNQLMDEEVNIIF